jgi:hypothetical protein
VNQHRSRTPIGGKCGQRDCLTCYPPLPRADDSVWALPTREPEKKEFMPNLAKALGEHWVVSDGERCAVALERIAKALENLMVILPHRDDP